MTRRLHITVRFLDNRYHGEEWPPSPARLFQAMVASATTGCRILNWPRNALRWFEKLEPPKIVAPDAPHGFAFKIFAPNNDSDSLFNIVSKGTPLKEASRQILTQKIFRPRILSNVDDAVVHYIWRIPLTATNPEEEINAQQVCNMARNLTVLGWGIDLVIGNGQIFESNEALPVGHHYVPAQDSDASISLNCPAEGFLADIERAYQAFRNRTTGPALDTDTHPKGFYPVPYRLLGNVPDRMFVAFELRCDKGNWRSFRWQDAMIVAAWLRHATGQRFRNDGWNSAHIDAYVSGHQNRGQENQRLSYVSLPSIGHEHADGRHRRVLVALPFGDRGEAISVLNRMTGDELISLTGEPMAWLTRGQPDGVLNCYVAESTEWLSVTPMVLHGLDCDKGRFRPRKAEKLILQAFHESGYNIETIDEFSYQSAPFWRGANAACYAQVPKHLGRWPKHHIRVVFKKPVKGPLIAGIGRHCGLGVFATPRPNSNKMTLKS